MTYELTFEDTPREVECAVISLSLVILLLIFSWLWGRTLELIRRSRPLYLPKSILKFLANGYSSLSNVPLHCPTPWAGVSETYTCCGFTTTFIRFRWDLWHQTVNSPRYPVSSYSAVRRLYFVTRARAFPHVSLALITTVFMIGDNGLNWHFVVLTVCITF